MSSSTPDCSSAIAYLKVVEINDDLPTIELSHADTPVITELPHGMLVAYLVDEGDTFAYVLYEQLEKQGYGLAQLHQIALSNLANLADTHLRVQPHGNVFGAFLDGHFEASLMLLDTLWDRELRDRVTGNFVAAFPARDILAFGDDANGHTTSELREIVHRVYMGGDHLLTPELFIRRGTAWEPYLEA